MERTPEERRDARRRAARRKREAQGERFYQEHEDLNRDWEPPEDGISRWWNDEGQLQLHLFDDHRMSLDYAREIAGMDLVGFHWRLHLIGDGKHPAPELGMLTGKQFRVAYPDVTELRLDETTDLVRAAQAGPSQVLEWNWRTGTYVPGASPGYPFGYPPPAEAAEAAQGGTDVTNDAS